jgi:hypothetical protein
LIVTVDAAGDVPLIRARDANRASSEKTASVSANDSSVVISWIGDWLRQAVNDVAARGQETCRGEPDTE